MACGCKGKGGMKGVINNRLPLLKKSTQNTVSAQSTSNNIQSVQIQSVQTNNSPLSGSDRTIERKRREAILRKLGRL